MSKRGPRMRIPKRSAPKPGPTPPAPLDVEALEADLELACLEAIRGDARGPHLARTLERVCTDVLRARGLEGRVQAQSSAAGTGVQITLAPGPQRVGVIRLALEVG